MKDDHIMKDRQHQHHINKIKKLKNLNDNIKNDRKIPRISKLNLDKDFKNINMNESWSNK